MAGNFPDGTLVVQFNPGVAASIQDRTLQRVYRDALFPNLLFRMEATAEMWAINLGNTSTFTRTGTIKPTTRPLAPNTDPSTGSYALEQWDATAMQFGKAIDTHMPTNYVTLASQYLRNMHQLGMHSGQSLNRIVRDKLYNAYVAGNTVTDAAATSGATTLHVANLNGFTRQLFSGRQTLVSSSNPIQITIPLLATTHNITGFTPDVAGDEIHGGTITITPAIGANLASRSAILARTRSQVVYSGGGNSVDDVASVDVFAVRDIRTAIAQARFNNLPPHDDGLFHWHLDPTSESQVFSDNEFQRLNQSMPDYVHYRRFALAIFAASVFYRNNEVPNVVTCDTDPTDGNTHGFELLNGTSVTLHRPIMTGQGPIEEKYIDEAKFISDAGVMGKIGEFAVTNGGVQVMTERIRLILRSPMDRLQQVTSAAWSWSGDFPVPSDQTSPTSPATFKRAVVVIHGE